ncbi:unnamed protein product [Caenorhabditis angaria]|uniref:G-protein coupled receptors family 1 profile domain-containing protein n=1 Tax=Caenorhabditis angaria TaxID=860376 RepID=A0A9P1IVL6_9PELO|nr:unnamed protein product [Caenorhabditis angaria]
MQLQFLQKIFTTFTAIICAFGIPFNLLSFFIYTRPSFRNRSINILLAALSFSDLNCCLLTVPVFANSHLENVLETYLIACSTFYLYPVIIMFQSLSVWLLVSITIDRYLAVCHPFMVNTYCTKNRAFITVAFVMIFSFAYNFVRYWEFSIIKLDQFNRTGKPENYTVVPNDLIITNLRENTTFMLWYQNVATLLSQFLLPLVVLCVLNLKVARTIMKASEQRRELVASVKREHSTAKMMIMVVIVFLVCYTFSFVLNVLEVFSPSIFQSDLGYFLNDVNNILIIINSSSPFYFYYNYSTRFRNQARRLYFLKWCFSQDLNIYDTENATRSNMDTKFKESMVSLKGEASTNPTPTNRLSPQMFTKPCNI